MFSTQSERNPPPYMPTYIVRGKDTATIREIRSLHYPQIRALKKRTKICGFSSYVAVFYISFLSFYLSLGFVVVVVLIVFPVVLVFIRHLGRYEDGGTMCCSVVRKERKKSLSLHV